MTYKRRREREKQVLRDAILLAAREIALAEGWSSVSIRKIADRIEYSPPTIYEYFANKEALLLVLMLEGFARLRREMNVARAAAPDPQSKLEAITTAYWRFASENPELYEVMYGLGGIYIETEEAQKPPEVQAVIGDVIDALVEWAQAEEVTLANPIDAFQILWGEIHGLVTLSMSGRLKDHNRDFDYTHRLIQQGVRTILVGWRSASQSE